MTFKKLLKKYSDDDVKFTKHAKEKMIDAPFDERFVLEKLFDLDSLVYEEYNKYRRTYKLIYKHSRDYMIVMVVSLGAEYIHIVTAYKTSKKIQKMVKEAGVIYIKRFKNG